MQEFGEDEMEDDQFDAEDHTLKHQPKGVMPAGYQAKDSDEEGEDEDESPE